MKHTVINSKPNQLAFRSQDSSDSHNKISCIIFLKQRSNNDLATPLQQKTA